MTKSVASPVLAARLRTVLVRLGRQLRRQDPPEMGIALFSALATLASAGDLSIGELAEIECLPSSAVTRVADRLEEAGMLIRRRNPSDRRGVIVAITESGRNVVDGQRRKGNSWLTRRLAQLSDAERSTVAAAIAVLEALLAADDDQELMRRSDPR